MFADLPLLSLVIWLPIVGGMVILLAGDKGDASGAKRLALLFSIATFALSIGLYTGFDATTSAMQFVERYTWIPAYNIYYHLGFDFRNLRQVIRKQKNSFFIGFSLIPRKSTGSAGAWRSFR